MPDRIPTGRLSARLVLILAASAAPAVLASCGSDDTGTGPDDDGNDAPEVASLDLRTGSDTLDVGASLQLDLTARTDDGTVVPEPDPTWTSRNEDVASVDNDGVVSGESAGRTWIVARSGGASDSARVLVLDPSSDARCESEGYPCSPSDVPDVVIARSDSLATELAEAVDGGATLAEAVAMAEAFPETVEARAGELALFFRLRGGTPTWVVTEALLQASGDAANAREPTAPEPARVVVGDDPEAKHALVLTPYQSDFGAADDGALVAGILEGTRGYDGNVVFEAEDENTTDDWFGWDGYDVIHVSSHGEQICDDEGGDCVTGLLTDIPASEWRANAPNDLGHARGKTTSGEPTVIISEDFFVFQYPFGLDALVWLSACESAEDPTLGQVLTRGEGVFFGWSNPVDANVARAASETFYTFMRDHGTVSAEGLEEVRDEGHDHDADATLRRTGGDPDVRIREVVTILEPIGGGEIEDGDEHSMKGVPDDAVNDTLPVLIRVEGVAAGDAADYTVHVEVEGTGATGSWPLSGEGGTRVEDWTWTLRRDLPLGFDVESDETYDIRAWVELPEGGESERTRTVALKRPDLVLHFDTHLETTIVESGQTTYESGHAVADVDLQLNEAGTAYTGSGTLHFEEYVLTPLGPCTIEDPGLVAYEVVLEGMGDGGTSAEIGFDADDPFLPMTCAGSSSPVPPIFPFAFGGLHIDQMLPTTSPIHWLFDQGWETVDDPSVVARRVFRQTVSDAGTTWTEDTTLEIRRKGSGND